MSRKYGRNKRAVTLRMDVCVLQVYAEIALRANHQRVLRGESGNLTAQDVLRHRLGSLPVVQLRSFKRGGV